MGTIATLGKNKTEQIGKHSTQLSAENEDCDVPALRGEEKGLRVGDIRQLNPSQIELAVIPQANNDEKTITTILGPEL